MIESIENKLFEEVNKAYMLFGVLFWGSILMLAFGLIFSINFPFFWIAVSLIFVMYKLSCQSMYKLLVDNEFVIDYIENPEKSLSFLLINDIGLLKFKGLKAFLH